MKLCIAICLLLLKSGFGYSQNTRSQLESPNSLLIKVSETLSSLKSIRYHNTRELNYSSENYLNISKWVAYYDFQSKDTIIGFKYQIEDATAQQFFNGTEKFELNKKDKTVSLDDQPDKKSFEGLAALYNSIITIKNILPLLISDKAATKYVNDTTINNTSYTVINVNIGKRRIQNLGFGFDAMITNNNFIYKIIVEKYSYLPFAVIQTNDLNNDLIRTSFTSIETNPISPSDLSWYYSTYTDAYKLAGKKTIVQLLPKGALAPEWKLKNYNSNKTISLTELKGQVILLDFWIKNCGPCIQSVSHLNELQNKFKGKSFKLISINAYDAKEDVNWFCKKHKANYTVLLDGKAAAEKYGVTGFPAFFIINKAGKIIYANAGFNESMQSEIERIIENAL